jgi:hypothetical protein
VTDLSMVSLISGSWPQEFSGHGRYLRMYPNVSTAWTGSDTAGMPGENVRDKTSATATRSSRWNTASFGW